MYFVISKLLFFLIKPLVWILALLGYTLFVRNQRRKKKALIAALVLLFFFSNTWVFNQFAKLSEAEYPLLKQYDVGILLGGFSNVNARNEIAFTSASDRILQAVALYKKGAIGKILISSGSADLFKNKIKEADLAAQYLRTIGIPDSAIVVENQSRNTNENIKYSYQLISKENLGNHVLIITSAWHIPRTKLIVQKQGVAMPDFYPTHFLSTANLSWDDYIIPSVGTMNNWEILIKEWVGYGVTKLGIS